MGSRHLKPFAPSILTLCCSTGTCPCSMASRCFALFVRRAPLRSADVDRVQAAAVKVGTFYVPQQRCGTARGHTSRLIRTWMAGRCKGRGDGAPETIRTSDLCLRRATLYPAELRARVNP